MYEGDTKFNILNCSLRELEDAVTELGDKKFRAAQIFGWLAKGVKDFDDMKNVPAAGWKSGKRKKPSSARCPLSRTRLPHGNTIGRYTRTATQH